ncbi:C40 family peptidase [Nonomuraea sp. NPDC049400]|uniref:C40 family peptidase n=1 Tax=Nonomuraea sp. NPDC049400 TaxID=3364352 RepID=UPI00379ABAD0
MPSSRPTARGAALTIILAAGTVAIQSPAADAASDARQARAAAVAVAVAKDQVGDVYRYGATGPNAFDCSGLAQYAWRKAGVRLPRVASSQYRALRVKVAWPDIKPGDLLFFWRFGHVGVYVGGGQIVHAPREGSRVRVDKLSQDWLKRAFSGAGRPGL